MSTPAGAQVLVVDDDQVSLLVAEHILARAGHSVTTATNAAEARRCIGESALPIDLIICDYEMPEETGLDLLESLLSDDHPPFVLLTGVSEADDLADSRVEHVSGFVTKPVQSDDFIALVDQLLHP